MPFRIEWADAGPIPVSPSKAKELAKLCAQVLRAEIPKAGQKGAVNLVCCDNAHIRALNKRFRKLDKVTDVLSFNYEEDDVFGEIYIATAKAKAQAPRWKNDFHGEMRRLVVHGSLHLSGFDHMNARDRKVMRQREDHYLGL